MTCNKIIHINDTAEELTFIQANQILIRLFVLNEQVYFIGRGKLLVVLVEPLIGSKYFFA